MTIEETRAAVEAYCGITDDNKKNFTRFMKMLDAYGQARELRGHVSACVAYTTENPIGTMQRCGDGWFCDRAQAIQQAQEGR